MSEETSGEAAYDVAGGAVVGPVLADVLLATHPAPCGYVGPGGRVVRDNREAVTDGNVADVVGEPDDRQRAPHPTAVELHVGVHRRTPEAARSRSTTPRSLGGPAVN